MTPFQLTLTRVEEDGQKTIVFAHYDASAHSLTMQEFELLQVNLLLTAQATNPRLLIPVITGVAATCKACGHLGPTMESEECVDGPH